MLRKLFVTCLVLSIFGMSQLRAADYFYGTSDYDKVKINDEQGDNPQETKLYQIFNKYFGQAYEDLTGTVFSDSDTLYKTLKIVPTSDRISVGDEGTVQAFFKDAAFSHVVSVLDPLTGDTKAEFDYTAWTINTPSTPASVSPAGSYDLVLQATMDYARPVGELTEREESMKVGDPYWSARDGAYMQAIHLYQNFLFDPVLNEDGYIHMIVLDLTWFYNEPAFLIALEDMYPGTLYGNPDWDFNDGVYVFQSMAPTTGAETTPEPASALILGLGFGLAGLPLARKFRKRKDSQVVNS